MATERFCWQGDELKGMALAAGASTKGEIYA